MPSYYGISIPQSQLVLHKFCVSGLSSFSPGKDEVKVTGIGLSETTRRIMLPLIPSIICNQPKQYMKTKNVLEIAAWQQDPGSADQPDGGLLIQVPAPDLSSSKLPTEIENPQKVPSAKIYPPGTTEFRYWSAAASLNRASAFWSNIIPDYSWRVGAVLPVDLYHGEDFNAYYDRVGLKFFQGNVGQRTIYSCESPDVVCHEHGHAVLDSIKPQLWDAASLEIAAFHEGFADCSNILCALQIPSLRRAVIAETSSMIYRSSRLSRLAEQLGWAIRQYYPTAVDNDCLRNAVNSFFYRDPNTLPSNGPASSLSSEPHSFSRIFTSAFFEGLALMFQAQPIQDEKNLLQVSIDMGKILAGGVIAASVVPAFYSQVAVSMIHVAFDSYPDIDYGNALRKGFTKHGIISPASSSVFSKDNLQKTLIKMPTGKNLVYALPRLKLSVPEYGLGTQTIDVHCASETQQFVIAGAALSFGSLQPTTDDVAARSFLEDLIRRGKLRDNSEAKISNKAIRGNTAPIHFKHTHELKSDGDVLVLKRLRIDCGLKH
jgi:hypothetical protein